ncbi:MAG: LptF/LptG family permease [Rickettsiaceae bacterium]|nr:LptF/LptG family permease [Rickettsiaceae bacterium]
MIYQKYIIRSILVPFFYALIILTGITWLGQVLRLIYLFEKQILLTEFLVLTLLIVPSLLHSILPFALVYSALYAYSNLKTNKEIIVLKSAGINLHDLMHPLVRVCLVVSVISIVNGSTIMPFSYNILKEKLYIYRGNFASSKIEEGIFSPLSKNLVLFLNKKVSARKFSGIILFDYRNHGSPAILFADQGEMIDSGDAIKLMLSSGSRQSFGKAGIFEIMKFERFNVSILDEKINERGENEKDSLERYIWELLNPKHPDKSKKIRFIAEGNGRIVWSLMNILLPISAICIFLRQEFRRKESLVYLLKSFGFALIFVVLHFATLSASFKAQYMNYILYLNLVMGIGITYYLSADRRELA